MNVIYKLLPHRYPFLMVDRIIETGPDFAIGLKNVSIDEPFFRGHFPNSPIMPAALITEALMQTSAFIGMESNSDKEIRKQFICVGFSMKFKQAVVPGDQLRLEVRLLRKLGEMARVSAIARIVGGGIAASGELTITLLHEEK